MTNKETAFFRVEKSGRHADRESCCCVASWEKYEVPFVADAPFEISTIVSLIAGVSAVTRERKTSPTRFAWPRCHRFLEVCDRGINNVLMPMKVSQSIARHTFGHVVGKRGEISRPPRNQG